MIPSDMQIEYPFVKLPYDCAVKEFKSSKKNVEKEMSSVLNSIINLKNDQNIKKVSAIETISNLVGRLQNLKRKLNETYTEQDEFYEGCRKRIVHLNVSSKENNLCYHKTRLTRLIIDYLVRQGHLKTAKKMMQEFQIEDLTELEIIKLEEANNILKELKNHSCETALKWCNSNKSKLRKIQSKFELKLIFQVFIEFIKQNKKNEALSFLKSKSEITQNYLEDLQKAMGCLINYSQLDKFPNYKTYFEEERWIELIDMFKKENFKIFSILTRPPLQTSLKAGLSSLKTIYCFNDNLRQKEKCPVCNDMMQKLAQKLPSTLKTVSSLICRITGEIMDEHNPPIMLPNGEVYSQKGISDLAEKNAGIIICPEKKDEYKLSQIIKIYLS